MSKKFICMNTDMNRVLLSGPNNDMKHIWSGEIGNRHVSSFKPIVFDSKLKFWINTLFYLNAKAVAITEKEHFTMPTTDYIWLRFKYKTDCKQIIKVYSEDCKHTPPNSSKIYHSGRVMIKGIGDFTWSDFVEVAL